IITIEDPVEYHLPWIRQSQVNPKAGVTFASGLRSILRQDPDVIMVGEIRDVETAQTAIQAALTGHMVFSTLHTNDAVGALTRLTDMGIEPFLITSSTVGILAQRLVRVICEKCKEPFQPPKKLLDLLGLEGRGDQTFFRGRGCSFCKQTGYRGRIGIFELLLIDETIRELVLARASASELKKEALKQGMRDLRSNGLQKAVKGLTTLEEVMRAVRVDVG
ncbi:MAG: Flp pilus assembly complex ATPase component TadA, partial [candidate division NC10 bacterium]|nr:Flp pilus assembly complex ATPase component TadA [candidate division NC10 bacterium]